MVNKMCIYLRIIENKADYNKRNDETTASGK